MRPPPPSSANGFQLNARSHGDLDATRATTPSDRRRRTRAASPTPRTCGDNVRPSAAAGNPAPTTVCCRLRRERECDCGGTWRWSGGSGPSGATGWPVPRITYAAGCAERGRTARALRVVWWGEPGWRSALFELRSRALSNGGGDSDRFGRAGSEHLVGLPVRVAAGGAPIRQATAPAGGSTRAVPGTGGAGAQR